MTKRSEEELDDLIRLELLKEGDDGTTPRPTIFFFYGGNFKNLGFAAKKTGYYVRSTAQADGVILETTTAVDAASFAPHAAQMEKWAKQFGCEYDNWECEVVKR
jgi:hypothetical protein